MKAEMKAMRKKARLHLSEIEVSATRYIRWAAHRRHYQLTYSKTFKRWKKNKYTKPLVRALKNSSLEPAQVNHVCNTLWVLEKKTSMDLGQTMLDLALLLYHTYDGEVGDYYSRVILRHKGFKQCTPDQALKEQKARGFIHINDFEEFDITWSHVRSIVNYDYYYPRNFAMGGDQYQSDPGNPGAYGGLVLVGVSGYTGTELGINRNKRHKRFISHS
jgi:hypothetical protein